ncbi:DNA polymerase III subunit gamma/tau [Anaerosalibacter bizertensis]|uniref:DNA-directed DNA polymerase n=1 Tax=Anaerosalibacter bizertensis TaxID=932217 RepID=A0A844FHF9_9FIRM|nr:DNA polymerase III subunit gamma/tau [Anaerosalibacter bizertensis]MBV1817986.1 DNA polymerase III subunit gamma/tau [Bacteroidales bacterium MSK.15.36]MBU5294643.1 DNA polymerase III subunit gamma/tau [Anaerosalibacter bizertensis]MCB5559343.1 DNA polymerase III subunit gamma/tau [Anaerosalibacter bizertensis]MCG4565210.1 DNA polymerase III subunit gamma/tau [Anaerosalibacter bizertensis]MCG4581998.1 DNA polymerase III subunit gamma/tau [Anaerosalibacter bizertensis]
MYQALYRRFRPKTFDEVLGQEHITTTLKNQILRDNIGHAYLFSGTRGTGKTSAAKIFARAVNCTNSKDGNPCNSCDICSGIIDESIMDVIEMDAASYNSVDDVRELREKVQYPPSRAKYKVYIIDEVHMLSKGAFNALLKTLEEPPKHLIFILATTEVEKLPQTILSRCQRFDFKRIGTQDIIKNLNNICNEIGLEAEEGALKLIARNSDGAMRDALSLLDQCISFREGILTYEDALDILGIANNDLMFNLIDSIKDKKLEEALNVVDDIIQNGKDINQFIKDLIYHFRNLMISKTSTDPWDIIDLEIEIVERYTKQAKELSLNFILKAIQVLNEGENQAKWSSQPRIILEMIVVRLISLTGEDSLEERIDKLEKMIQSGNITVSEKKADEKINTKNKIEKKQNTSKQVEEKTHEEDTEEIEEVVDIVDDGKDISFNEIKKEWPNVLKLVKSKRVSTQALLKEGKPLFYDNKMLTIGYGDGFGFHKQAIEKDHNREFVEKIISSHFNKNIKVKFVMANSMENEDGKEEKKNNEIKEMAKEVIDFFGEDLVRIIDD